MSTEVVLSDEVNLPVYGIAMVLVTADDDDPVRVTLMLSNFSSPDVTFA